MSLLKLENVIQNYAWGSKESLSALFGIQNENAEPQAEIWMGTHPGGCSKVASMEHQPLPDVIARDSKGMLGDYTKVRFGDLPYLFKVLAAETPLSIQVHPSKSKAEAGFARENAQGIPLNAANRNYKDPNHKPELVYALTFYKAMNGFRPLEHILALFAEVDIPTLSNEVAALAANRNSDGLRQFFSAIISLTGERKETALRELYAAYKRPAKTVMAREALEYSADFSLHYPGDVGLFAPLILNTIELAPGEAMFLHAETPHAYVKGTGLEIMASSDNVLRAGLTSKHIDVPELLENTKFVPIDPEQIKLAPVRKEGKLSYPIPVDDFGFDILFATDECQKQYLRSAEILLCIQGEVKITTSAADEGVSLKPGESVFISNNSVDYQYQGNGILARAYN